MYSTKLNSTDASLKINLGCGSEKLLGYMGVDNCKTSAADIILNLAKFPWKLKSNAYLEVRSSHFLEHLAEPLKAIQEIHRILKPGGKLSVIAPYYASPGAFYDLTHKCFFGYKTFDPFCDNREYSYFGSAKFKYIKRRIVFPKLYQLLQIERIANLFPRIYEDFFAFIFPAREIHYELEAVK